MSAKILVVDDNPDAREMLTRVLEDQGYTVAVAEDGETALNLIQADRPDLIITDVQMPKVDGIEMIKKLRSHAELEGIPVVVMTTCGNETIRSAIDAGASAAASKPVMLDSLIKLIRSLLPCYWLFWGEFLLFK